MNAKIKDLFLKIRRYISVHRYTLYLIIPFLLMDIFTRAFGYAIGYFPTFYPAPNIFTLVWIFLFIGIITCLKGKGCSIAYWVLFILAYVLFLTNTVYYSLTGFYFSFNLMLMASEGSSYIVDTIIHANPIIYAVAVIILIIAIIVFRKFSPKRDFRPKRLLVIFVIFIVLHLAAPLGLGFANSHLKWSSFKNPRNVYNSYSDSNKSMRVSGLYEYSFRNFYITFVKPKEKISSKDKEFLDGIYKAKDTKTSDKYTGMFKGKNVIFLQLEGMDTWLLTKKTTPNLYNLKKNSIDFKKHYSIYTGGGSTFNSEFAVNTGFTTPASYTENVYTLNTNTNNHTMAKLFKNEGYTVNAFHMNTSGFYSRGINYKSWGYDNYFGLKDIGHYSDLDYELDRHLILNKTFYNQMFKQKGKFVDYIISYTPHTPFTTSKEVGKLVAENKYGKGNVPDLSEEETAKLMVGETDYMVGLLIQALKDNGLYDNTVIVAYADHYLYTINDKTVLDKYKNTQGNLINNTPFFIWSSDIKSQSVNKVTMQMNILPTVLNLFGIDYNSNYYLGTNALSPKYKGLAYFSDYSWYDGNVYVENGEVVNRKKIPQKKLEETSDKVNKLFRKNDLTLKYDYFKTLGK
ncbi:LTA synthase family protein [uncultured Eubacterium sp.]|uniref:LTA synthase family protein n=1 Tax=uncultured Eubacterium sp. TaxID=165185 RepID=UPI00267467C2|nr:alkaline phosphatase family protein [uncultured Eubacterium sp.]